MIPIELPRRRVLAILPGLVAASAAHAAPAVDRVARIIVGAGPGGGTDLLARLVAESLAGDYAPQVVVENRPGAVSRIAAEAVKAAAPDGTTLLLCPMPVLSLFPHVYRTTTRYDPLTDFLPATTIGALPYGLLVPPGHLARDVAGFVAWARDKGEVNFFAPLGSPQHMLALAFAQEAGIRLTVVPYRASAQAMQDLLGGRLDGYMSHMGDVAPPARSGLARLLMVTSAARLPRLPDIPTATEQGFPDLTAQEAMCIVLPAGSPPALAEALHAGIMRATATEAMRERLARGEMSPMVLSPADTAALLRSDFAAWGAAVRATGFSAEG